MVYGPMSCPAQQYRSWSFLDSFRRVVAVTHSSQQCSMEQQDREQTAEKQMMLLITVCC